MIYRSQLDKNHILEAKRRKNLIVIRPKKTFFYTVFCLVFCLSGLITMLTPIPYRMGLVTVFIIPLTLWYRPKIDRVTIAYVGLALVVLISAIYNSSSVREVVLFMRILGFSYLIYYLAESFLNSHTIVTVIRVSVFVAIIQLPIVLLQQLVYRLSPEKWFNSYSVVYVDFDFGTFNFKNDAPMAFFLTLIIVFLLFDKKRNYIIPYKGWIVLWLSITVFITHAKIVYLILILVWSIYFLLSYLKIKQMFYTVLLSVLVAGILFGAGLFTGAFDDLASIFTRINLQLTDKSGIEKYLSGEYARGGAIAYYLNSDFLWIGDGPSKYSDVFTKKMLRGNVGHIFTFYSEVGFLGWFLSMLIFFLMAFPGRKWRMRISWVGCMAFISVLILSFTTQIMNSIDVVLIYVIIMKSYLISVMDSTGAVNLFKN